MNPAIFCGAALLALAYSRPTPAQTTAPATVPVTGGVSNAATSIPRIPPAGVPGEPGATPSRQPGAAATLTTPASTLYPHGVPARDIDAGTSRAAQPRSGQATPGAQPTKSIFKGRKRQ